MHQRTQSNYILETIKCLVGLLKRTKFNFFNMPCNSIYRIDGTKMDACKNHRMRFTLTAPRILSLLTSVSKSYNEESHSIYNQDSLEYRWISLISLIVNDQSAFIWKNELTVYGTKLCICVYKTLRVNYQICFFSILVSFVEEEGGRHESVPM